MKKKDPLKYNKIIMLLLMILILIVGFIFLTVAKEDYIEVNGVTKPETFQIVTPEISGIIKKIYFNDGDIVKEGNLLVELKDEDLLNQLNIKNRNLELTILKKENDLNKNNLKTKEYEKEIESLKLEIQNIKSSLNKCKVYSTISGVVYEDSNSPKEGLFFNAGSEIQKVYSNAEIYAELFISEKDYSKIKIDQKVKLFINAFPYTKYKIFSGKIIQLKNIKNSVNSYSAIAIITDPYFNYIDGNKTELKKLFSGLSLQARIYIEKKKLSEYLIQ